MLIRRRRGKTLAGVQMSKNLRKPPPPLYPLVMRVPGNDFHLTAEQFAALEKTGNVTLSEKQQIQLDTLADFWINDLRTRSSARPKQFRKSLKEMKKAFEEAEKVCQWDQGVKYHMVHWAMETPVKEAHGFPIELAALEQNLKTMRERLAVLEQYLPDDPGRQRPFNDERRIIFLADVFEDAGGKAVVYAGGYYNAESTADTAFRRFAQQFYAFLPAADKREPGGLDDALRDALAARRAKRASSR
jgi:hypothetical protein